CLGSARRCTGGREWMQRSRAHCLPDPARLKWRRIFRPPPLLRASMTQIKSAIDPKSATFRANKAAMDALVDELATKTAEAGRGGNVHARERHVSRGRLLPRDRVERLIDPGSPFLEVGALAANGMYGGDVHGAGMIAGIGRVQGREVMVVCN